MKRIGVCGSDIHVYHGKHALTPYPVVQGHEVSGIVEKVGGSVRALAPGDLVTIQPQVTCGTCYACTHGAYHICDNLKVMGFQTTGAGSELFAVEASKVLKLPARHERGARGNDRAACRRRTRPGPRRRRAGEEGARARARGRSETSWPRRPGEWVRQRSWSPT